MERDKTDSPQRLGQGLLRKNPPWAGRGVRTTVRGRRLTDAERESMQEAIAMDNLAELSPMVSKRIRDQGSMEGMARELAVFLKDNLALYDAKRRRRYVSESYDAEGLFRNSLLAKELWFNQGLMNHYVLRGGVEGEGEGEDEDEDGDRAAALTHVVRARYIPFGVVGNDPGQAVWFDLVTVGAFPNVGRFLNNMFWMGDRLMENTRVVVDVGQDGPPRVVTNPYLRGIYARRRETPILRTALPVVIRTTRDGVVQPDSEAIVIPTMRLLTIEEVVGAINDVLRPRGERVAEGNDGLAFAHHNGKRTREQPIERILRGNVLKWNNSDRLHYRTVGLDDAGRPAPAPLYRVEACEYHGKALTLAYQGRKRPEAWEIETSLRGRVGIGKRDDEDFSADFSLKWMRKERAHNNQLVPVADRATGELLMDPSDDDVFVVYRMNHYVSLSPWDDYVEWLPMEGPPASWTMAGLLSAYLRLKPGEASHASRLRFYAGKAYEPYPDEGDGTDDDEDGGDGHEGMNHAEEQADEVKVPIVNDEDVRRYLVEERDRYGYMMVDRLVEDVGQEDEGEGEGEEEEGGGGGVVMDMEQAVTPLRFSEGQRVTRQDISQDELLDNIMVVPSGDRVAGPRPVRP